MSTTPQGQCRQGTEPYSKSAKAQNQAAVKCLRHRRDSSSKGTEPCSESAKAQNQAAVRCPRHRRDSSSKELSYTASPPKPPTRTRTPRGHINQGLLRMKRRRSLSICQQATYISLSKERSCTNHRSFQHRTLVRLGKASRKMGEIEITAFETEESSERSRDRRLIS